MIISNKSHTDVQDLTGVGTLIFGTISSPNGMFDKITSGTPSFNIISFSQSTNQTFISMTGSNTVVGRFQQGFATYSTNGFITNGVMVDNMINKSGSMVYNIEVSANGLDSSNNSFTGKFFAGFKYISGSVSQIGSTDMCVKSDYGSDVYGDFTRNTTNVFFKTQGATGSNINWNIYYKIHY